MHIPDYRPAEGRHSGNGFRYAEEDGYLQKYCILGIHENYLPQNVWMDMVNNPFIDCITYEDIFIRQKRTFVQSLTDALDFMGKTSQQEWELDLDSIEGVLSSAATPAGLSSPACKDNMYRCLPQTAGPHYLHICEGATRLEDGRKDEIHRKAHQLPGQRFREGTRVLPSPASPAGDNYLIASSILPQRRRNKGHSPGGKPLQLPTWKLTL